MSSLSEHLQREPAYFSQGGAAHSSLFPPGGWGGQRQGWARCAFTQEDSGTSGSPDPQPFCLSTSEALSFLSSAEPGSGLHMPAFWTSLRGQTVLPIRALLLSVSAQTGPRGCSQALRGSPSSRARSSVLFLALKVQGPAYTMQLFPSLLFPLVFLASSFGGHPAKSPPGLLPQFLTSA